MDDQPPQIFISYSRKDGAEFAGKLRERLLQEKFFAWQDLTALECGRDWWSQIVQALKSKALRGPRHLRKSCCGRVGSI